MKKSIFLLALGALVCSCCSEIQLISGNYDALKQQAGTAEFVLDLSNTQAVEYAIQNPFSNELHIGHVVGTIDERNQQAGEDYVKDWPTVREEMASTFVYRFNRKFGNKGTILCLGQGTTPYRVVFHVKHLDFGNTGANIASGVVNAVFGSGIFYGGNVGGCICDGTIELVEIETGKTLGIVEVRPVKTDGSPSETARLCELMSLCGRWCAKRAK